MNIFNEVVRGAASQFGREFGRAGANSVLKGKNYYSVQTGANYSGRIKPSDSLVVRSIKEINKIKFATTNKANTSRLIEATDVMLDVINFEGLSTLNEINDIKVLLDDYNDKFEHGSALIDDDFKDKSVDFLEGKRQEFVDNLEIFNLATKSFINTKLEFAAKNKKEKNTAVLLSLFLGSLGVHKFYLGINGHGFLYLVFSWTFIPFILSLFNFFSLLFMTNDKFNTEYNPAYTFYSQFKLSD